jgi:uncharacterized protein
MVSKDTDGKIFVGKSEKPENLNLRLANRHGLITGATGTGKTVSLQVLAEGFSNAGVPVFAADIKGDLSGVGALGEGKDFILKRAAEIGLDFQADEFPVIFWDLFGEQGHPIRATVSEMGPLLLSRLMGLNETQEGVLNIAFRVADEQGLLLLDLKDLRAIIGFVGENAATLTTHYGNVSTASVGAIQRQLLVLDAQGGEKFFGEPTLNLDDLMRTDRSGRGMISILAADKLMNSPRLYSTFLLWLLSELFEKMPEVGDPESRSSSSSSTRRISCSTRRRKPCSTRSSRSFASSARRAWASISSRKIRSTCRTPCSASSAIACSTRSAPIRRAISGR